MEGENKKNNSQDNSEEKKFSFAVLKSKILKYFNTIKKQPYVLPAIFAAAAVFLGLVFGYYIAERGSLPVAEEGIGEEEEQSAESDLYRRMIDGVLVKKGEEKFYPAAIMIENHWDARPSSGLSKANLVFESITEGGITRFLAIYADGSEISEIGPVRSARPYYLDWTSEFDAMYMHVGGSPEALNKIRNYNIKDLNEYYYGGYYWRNNGQARPHNVYTSGELVEKALDLKNLEAEDADYSTWKFKDDLPEGERPEKAEITIDYGSEVFNIIWKYDPESNEYIRQMDGEIHKDKDGSEIRAKNIAVAYMKMWVLDEVGRKRFETIGEGKAVVFRDGKAVEGTWKKASRQGRTRFYNEEENEIEFNAGTTWIEVLPNGYEIDWQ